MRTKVTLVLIFLNVALFFFIFKFERAWRTDDALREARRRVLGSETAEIRSLKVTSSVPGGPSFSAVRNRDVWMLTEPLDWPANQHAILSLLHELQFLENETSFSVTDVIKNGRSLADYGLEKPRVTIAFRSSDSVGAATADSASGPETVLQIGDTTNVGKRLYVLSPDGTRIHVVNRSLVDAVSVPLEQLRADTLFSILVFEARALSVQTSGARVRIRREGSRWLFDTIVNARASKTAMDLTINDLNRLRAKSFPSTPPAVLPSASPTLRVTLDGNNRSETLLLGDPVKPAAGGDPAAAPAAETEFHAQLMNGNSVRSPVFTVVVPSGPDSLLDRLQKSQNELRERRVLDLDPASVTSITIAAPNQPPLTLQRLDSNAPDSRWQLVRDVEGASGPQTLAADPSAVRQLLDRLTLLSATRFESDAPSSAQIEAWGFNRPEREIRIMTSAAPGAANRPTLLQLGTDNTGAVFARVGPPNDPGPSVYAVAVDLARDFPVSPQNWRDRTLREVPATGRIAALKLTDLSTQQVIFETTFDAAGRASNEPREAAALQELINGLRVLRARQFVQNRFVDRLMLAGDERTWRFQLDTTIALPRSSGGEQTSTSTLLFTERVGGAQQLAGSREFDAVFEAEQSVVDGLWALAYGTRDPGPQPGKN